MDEGSLAAFRAEMQKNFPDMELVYSPLDYEHWNPYRDRRTGNRRFPQPYLTCFHYIHIKKPEKSCASAQNLSGFSQIFLLWFFH